MISFDQASISALNRYFLTAPNIPLDEKSEAYFASKGPGQRGAPEEPDYPRLDRVLSEISFKERCAETSK